MPTLHSPFRYDLNPQHNHGNAFVQIHFPPLQATTNPHGSISAWHFRQEFIDSCNQQTLQNGYVGYYFQIDSAHALIREMSYTNNFVGMYSLQSGEKLGLVTLDAFIFNCRHVLHMPLALIARLVHADEQGRRVTASSVGARYVRLCNDRSITPYLSATQTRNRARTAVRTSALNDNAMAEIPDYLTDEVQQWFNSIDISFGHEIEVDGLSVNRAFSVLNSLADLELEHSTNYRHTFGSEWKVVPDGTCSAEIVSPPMRNGITDFLQVRRVMFALKQRGARVTSRCGGHVHFGVEHLKASDRSRTIEAHHIYEPMFDAFVAGRRRGHTQFTNPRSVMEMEMLADAFRDNCGQVASRDANGNTVMRGEVLNHPHRYRHWNVLSWVKYGTFENRQLEGCLNPKKMFAWLALNRAFIDACRDRRRYVRSEQELLVGVNAETAPEQMLDRIASLSNMPESVRDLIKSYFSN